MLVGIPPYYNDNIKILYQNIEKGKLKIPKYLSNEAKKCLQRMLNRNPSKRNNRNSKNHCNNSEQPRREQQAAPGAAVGARTM